MITFLQHITGIMHREEFIADHMIKVGYAVVSVYWRSADHLRIKFFFFFFFFFFMTNSAYKNKFSGYIHNFF